MRDSAWPDESRNSEIPATAARAPAAVAVKAPDGDSGRMHETAAGDCRAAADTKAFGMRGSSGDATALRSYDRGMGLAARRFAPS